MRLCENEDCVIMRLLQNGEVDGMRQCYGKSLTYVMFPNMMRGLDEKVLKSYRPVSKFSFMSKYLEKMISNRLTT